MSNTKSDLDKQDYSVILEVLNTSMVSGHSARRYADIIDKVKDKLVRTTDDSPPSTAGLQNLSDA